MKVGKIFLELLSKHFPRISLLHKSFSKTLKFIYTCMPKEKKSNNSRPKWLDVVYEESDYKSNQEKM